MNDGSQFIDIIIFAMVAVFLGLRLRGVLGRRTGNEPSPLKPRQPQNPVVPGEKVIDLSQRRRPVAPSAFAADDHSLPAGLARIAAADGNFTADGFCQGANAAFEMILAAFTKGDEPRLRSLLADSVFQSFAQAIRARNAAGEVCFNQLVRLVSSEIVEAVLDGSTARVSMRFVSQQITLLKDAQGAVVEGDPQRIVQLSDIWTFARDVRASDPNWLLTATRSSDE